MTFLVMINLFDIFKKDKKIKIISVPIYNPITDHIKENIGKFQVIFSPSRKFIWFKNAKVAGTSMYRGIMKREILDLVSYKEQPTQFDEWWDNLTDRKLKKYFKFAFVRNPWDRALSVYSNHYYVYCKDFREFVDKIKVIVPFINDNFTFELEEEFYVDYSRVVFNTLYNKDLEFAHRPWDGDEVIFDPQFIPQYLFTHNEYGEQLVDTIGHFENFAEDAAKILERLGIDHPIEKIHASDHPLYRDVYTPEMVDIIADAYAKDIEMFGYEF